jgi:hypothetical protein
VGLKVCLFIECFVEELAGLLIGWLDCMVYLVGLSVGWLVGWFDD